MRRGGAAGRAAGTCTWGAGFAARRPVAQPPCCLTGKLPALGALGASPACTRGTATHEAHNSLAHHSVWSVLVGEQPADRLCSMVARHAWPRSAVCVEQSPAHAGRRATRRPGKRAGGRRAGRQAGRRSLQPRTILHRTRGQQWHAPAGMRETQGQGGGVGRDPSVGWAGSRKAQGRAS